MAFAIEPKRSNIILVVAGISSAAVAFVIGVFVGNTIPGPNLFSQDTLSSWVTAAATVMITVLTFILAVETWRLRAAQSAQIENLHLESIQPSVSISLSTNPAGIHFMDARISNTGKGIAKNIRFSFRDRNGSPATDATEPIIKPFKKLAMFEHGIESLGVGQELSSFVFSFLDLRSEIGQDIFSPYLNIVINYEDVEGHSYSNTYAIDFIQFKGISKLGDSPVEAISSEIKKLRQTVEKVGNSSNRLGIDVYDSQDRETEAKNLEARIEQQMRRNSN